MNSKLIKELPELVEKKVISQEVALKIENYYQLKTEKSPNGLFTIFGVLGSVLVGLGIVLILAHNWDYFPKIIKTTLAFIPLLIGQFLVGFSILKNRSNTWKEASGTFLFFAVGASIAMVSQIYNIPGNFDSYMFTWIVLCIPLIYILKSNALALLHIIYATIYACSLGYGYPSKAPWLWLLLILVFLPYYVKLIRHKLTNNITSIFNWLLPLSAIIVLPSLVFKFEEAIFLAYIILFGLFYNLGKTPTFNSLKLRQNGYLVLGSLGTVILLLISSFKWVWQELMYASPYITEIYFIIILFIITLSVLLYLFVKKRIDVTNLFHYTFIIIAILFFIGIKDYIIPTIITNILLLILGVNAIKIGVNKIHLGILNYGLIIITALIFCRFFDTNISFVIRGLLFVIVGIGFFIANYMMLKKRNNKTLE